MESSGFDVTQLLQQWSEGRQEALGTLAESGAFLWNRRTGRRNRD
jgi:hypothetical protein